MNRLNFSLICGIISLSLLITGCEKSGSGNGAGLNTPDIEYNISCNRNKTSEQIDCEQRMRNSLARVMAVTETSVFRKYYRALISEITVVEGTRPAVQKPGIPVLFYLGWIKGSHVRVAGDSITDLTDRQIDYLIAHEAEHRAEGLVTGNDDPDHLTRDQCLPDRGEHPKCHFKEALNRL